MAVKKVVKVTKPVKKVEVKEEVLEEVSVEIAPVEEKVEMTRSNDPVEVIEAKLDRLMESLVMQFERRMFTKQEVMAIVKSVL